GSGSRATQRLFDRRLGWSASAADCRRRRVLGPPSLNAGSLGFRRWRRDGSGRAERMLGGVALGDDFLRSRMTGDGAFDRLLGRFVVVFLNLLVVGGLPVDEHADADKQVVGFPRG